MCTAWTRLSTALCWGAPWVNCHFIHLRPSPPGSIARDAALAANLAEVEDERGNTTKNVSMDVDDRKPAAKMPDQGDDDEVEDADRKLQGNYEEVEEAAALDVDDEAR